MTMTTEPTATSPTRQPRQPTMKQLHAAAKKKFKEFYIDYSPSAPDAEMRAAWRELNKADAERKKQIETELAAPGFKTLLDRMTVAARFVCDVNGDFPSIDELRKVLADAERMNDLKEQRDELAGLIKSRRAYDYRYRLCVVSRAMPGFPVAHVECEADTAAELMEKILSLRSLYLLKRRATRNCRNARTPM